MSVAISIGVGSVIAAGVGAGATIYGAHKASEASKDATDTAAKGTKEALDFQKEVYNKRLQDLAPYTAIGKTAITKMGDLMGVPAAPTNTWTQKNPDGSSSGFLTPEQMQGFLKPTGGQTPITQMGQPQSAASPRGAPAPPAPLAATGNIQAPPVKLQSPDGSETQVVPAEQAEYYIKQGARRVA